MQEKRICINGIDRDNNTSCGLEWSLKTALSPLARWMRSMENKCKCSSSILCGLVQVVDVWAVGSRWVSCFVPFAIHLICLPVFFSFSSF